MGLGGAFPEDNVAEWLRRLPAKELPFRSVGSSPAVVVLFNYSFLFSLFD